MFRPAHGQWAQVDCRSCHGTDEFQHLGGNWSHPTRPLADHLRCMDCHRVAPHDVAHPLGLPPGDYKANGCYACHKQTDIERHWLSRHDERTLCRDCHPPHAPFRAALPVALFPAGATGSARRNYDWQLSNELCLHCHSANTLLWNATGRFTDTSGTSYHELHLASGQCLCIECHAAHGSTQLGLLRRELLDGEPCAVLPTPSGGNCTVACHGVDHVSWRYGAARQ